ETVRQPIEAGLVEKRRNRRQLDRIGQQEHVMLKRRPVALRCPVFELFARRSLPDRVSNRRLPVGDVMIVRVQRPFMPTDGPWLVYDEERQRTWSIPAEEVTPAARKIMGGRWQAWFEAQARGQDVFLIKLVCSPAEIRREKRRKRIMGNPV